MAQPCIFHNSLDAVGGAEVWVLNPPHPLHQKTSDLCWGLEIVASPVSSGKLLALLQCLQCHCTMQTQKDKSVFSGTSRCQSKQDARCFNRCRQKKKTSFFQQQLVSPSSMGEFHLERETKRCWEESHGDQCKRHRLKLLLLTI